MRLLPLPKWTHLIGIVPLFATVLMVVHVPPGFTQLPVPAAFLEPNTLYEVEVIALEKSGNQIISVGFFTTARK